MTWQVSALLRAVVAYLISPVLTKKEADLPASVIRLAWMFGFCFLFSIGLLALNGGGLHSAFAWIAGIGALNAAANFCYWRALNLSLSKSAIFAQADDLLSMGLAFVVLGETRFISPVIGGGIALCFIAALVLACAKDAQGVPGTRLNRGNLLLLGWVLGYSVFWGVDLFFSKIAADQGVSIPEYAAWRYGSTLLCFLAVLALRRKSGSVSVTLSRSGLTRILVLAVLAWTGIVLEYYTLTKAPLVISQPFFQMTELVFPLLAGWLIFKEGRSFRLPEWISAGLALAGGAIIAVSF